MVHTLYIYQRYLQMCQLDCSCWVKWYFHHPVLQQSHSGCSFNINVSLCTHGLTFFFKFGIWIIEPLSQETFFQTSVYANFFPQTKVPADLFLSNFITSLPRNLMVACHLKEHINFLTKQRECCNIRLFLYTLHKIKLYLTQTFSCIVLKK